MSEVLETRVYGTNSTRANIAKVELPPASRQTCLSPVAAARALDTVKTAAIEPGYRLYRADDLSNCSAATAIAVVYNGDARLSRVIRTLTAPRISSSTPKIIAEAPAEYFWAGGAMPLSKQPEVEYATSADNLEHTAGLGLHSAHTCSEPQQYV